MSIRTQHQQSLSDDLETDDFHNLVCIFKLKPPHQYHRRQLEIINEVFNVGHFPRRKPYSKMLICMPSTYLSFLLGMQNHQSYSHIYAATLYFEDE